MQNKDILMTIVRNSSSTLEGEQEILRVNETQLKTIVTKISELDKYAPNGTDEEIKLGILHNKEGYYVSNEGTKKVPNFHVWIPDTTHAVCDSAYSDISLAVCRCDYAHKTKLKPNRRPNVNTN